MKVKVIYGASCAGKSTLAKAEASDNDLIWDYDKILMACTNRENQLCAGHPMTSLIVESRKHFIEMAKQRDNIDTLYIPTLWISDGLREELDGLDVEEIFLDTDKDECIRRCKLAEDRPDKGAWINLINEWFNKHGSEVKAGEKNEN